MSSVNNFNQVFQANYKPLVAFANKYLKNLDDAEEIVQIFFTDLYAKGENFSQIRNLKAYLFQSIYHRCLNHLKARKSELSSLDNDYSDPTYTIEESIEATEFEYQIYQLIENLPKSCKEVFKLSRFENLNNDEIALKKDISKRTVETHISNALKNLRENINKLNASESDKFKIYSILF